MKHLLMAFVGLFLLAACHQETEPTAVTIPPGITKKIEQLNAELVLRQKLALLLTHATLTQVVSDDKQAELHFSDATTLLLPCVGEAADFPFIGAKEEAGTLCWAVNVDGQQTVLVDPSGHRLTVAQTLPLIGLDENGYWTVATEGLAPWRLTTDQGKPLLATGKESISQFCGVTESGQTITVKLTDQTALATEKIALLSQQGTANCYLVTAAGRYAFNAQVRGNGVGDQATTGYDPQLSGENLKADWLWSSTENLLTDITYNQQSGTINFSASSGKGNAVIALFSGDEVVWSWHIWLTDEPQTMTYENGLVFQDRNLGAISAEAGSTDAYGLYYQWGRKDPFSGGVTTETSATAFAEAKKHTFVNPAYPALTWKAEAASAASIDEAARHPMTFYSGKVGVSSVYDWLSKPVKTLWGATKKLNDPCPPGYKIPEISAWDNFSASHQYIDGVSVWDGAKYGMSYTYNGRTAWYPAQGYRNQTAGNLVGLGTTRTGNYWSSEAALQTSKFFYFQKKLSTSSGSINTSLDKNRSFGYAVRCCKE